MNTSMENGPINLKTENNASKIFISVPDEYPLLEDTEYYINSVVIPAIATFGVVGNLLNLAVLSIRYSKRETDASENGVLLGLISLAVSDMFFCIGAIPSAFYDGFRTIFEKKDASLYYQIYSIYYQNVFIKTSTALTTVIALGRYFGICHPLKLRKCARAAFAKVTIASTVIFWMTFNLPLIWTFDVIALPGANGTYIFILDTGKFINAVPVYMAFTFLWATIGYFIPALLLCFCNCELVRALRRSQRLRQRNARYCNVSAHDHRFRITLTLIALTSMFILLVSPSEILHFYKDVVHAKTSSSLERAVVCTNLLQAVNFSCHFILYCVVNPSFRGIILNAVRIRYVRCVWTCFNYSTSTNNEFDTLEICGSPRSQSNNLQENEVYPGRLTKHPKDSASSEMPLTRTTSLV